MKQSEVMKIKILHIERFHLIRRAIKSGLENHNDIDVVASSDNSKDAFRLIIEHNPNLLVSSASWNDGWSLDFLPTAKEIQPTLKVILLTMHFTHQMVDLCLKSKLVEGFIAKRNDIEELYWCIQKVVEGKRIYFIPEYAV
jgi:DNA-binding NarL/FixJ family response regulator